MAPFGKTPPGGGDHEDFNLEQMEKETEEMLKLRYINKDNAKFQRTDGGFANEGTIFFGE